MLREKKTPKQAQAYLTQLFQHNVSQDTSAPQRAQHVPLGQGRRPARLRERREARPVAGQARLLPDPEGDAPDRDAARGRQREQQGRGAAVRQLALHARRADDLGAERLPVRRPERREELPRAVPAAAAALHDQVRRRLGQGEHPVLRPDERHRREDRAEPGAVHWLTSSHGCRGRGDAPSALRR